MIERNFFKERLTVAELRALAERTGGARELVKPTARGDVEGMSDAAIVAWLAEDPKRLRRPIIDTGDAVHLGFTKSVREALA
ncbi:MAG TPA: ArsC/Spx/MgsR family protein [Actinomycetota bacterium]|nr:ArsC/Spx/MgsR family protein [Actinomycetota bacterium]